MSLFQLEPGLAIWTWISFLVLFGVLSRFAFPKLLQSLKERETMIAESIDQAAAIKRRIADLEEERGAVLHKARAEADRLIREARAEAESLRQRLAEKAEAQAEEIVAEARRRMDEERKAALEALTGDLAVFVCQASEKVIGKSFTGDAERTWAKELAARL